MKEITRKIITFVVLGIAIVATVLSVLFAMNNGDVKDLAAVKANGLFDATFWILICLVAVSIIAILWFVIKGMAKKFAEDKGYWKKFLGILLAIVVVCIAAYAMSKGNDINQALMEKNNISESTSKLIGAACYVVYILVIAAACAIVYTEVAKSFKKK